jgi:hypothetical protein
MACYKQSLEKYFVKHIHTYGFHDLKIGIPPWKARNPEYKHVKNMLILSLTAMELYIINIRTHAHVRQAKISIFRNENWKLTGSSWQCTCSSTPSVQPFITKNKTTAALQSTHSLDHASCDFLFPNMKFMLNRRRSNDVLELTQNSQQVLNISIRKMLLMTAELLSFAYSRPSGVLWRGYDAKFSPLNKSLFIYTVWCHIVWVPPCISF